MKAIAFNECTEPAYSIPPGWRELSTPYGRAFRTTDGGLSVIVSLDTINGKQWRHLSVSRRSRIPSYEDLLFVRRSFIAKDAAAYQVFPPEKEHVNMHEYCLHLWQPVGFDPFPDVLR